MLTLLLVASLCDSSGCGYSDVTSRFPEASTNRNCLEVALAINLQNAAAKEPTRFVCIPPAEYRRLVKSQAF